MAAGMYDKYRVVRTDDLDAEITLHGAFSLKDAISALELDGFVFVLRPDHDYHARVALAAYTESVRAYNKELAEDLHDALELMDPPTRMEPD